MVIKINQFKSKSDFIACISFLSKTWKKLYYYIVA